MKIALPLALALAFGAAPAAADPPRRTTSLTVYGNEPCPTGEGDEVVVCARKPEGERYRIPKELRDRGEVLSERSWGSRTEMLEEANRATMPGGCSPVGSYGQSGCHQQMIRDWYAQRRRAR